MNKNDIVEFVKSKNLTYLELGSGTKIIGRVESFIDDFHIRFKSRTRESIIDIGFIKVISNTKIPDDLDVSDKLNNYYTEKKEGF